MTKETIVADHKRFQTGNAFTLIELLVALSEKPKDKPEV